jgi:hypothetical protein
MAVSLLVIPGHAERVSYDVPSHIGESRATISRFRIGPLAADRPE